MVSFEEVPDRLSVQPLVVTLVMAQKEVDELVPELLVMQALNLPGLIEPLSFGIGCRIPGKDPPVRFGSGAK